MPKILVVDDEAAVLRSTRMALKTKGFTDVSTLDSGESVAEVVSHEGSDLVLLDMNLSPYRGEEVLAKLKKVAPKIPVIVVTGSDDVELAVECMKLGAFDFLVKPVQVERLAATIRRALDYTALEDEVTVLREKFLEVPEDFDRGQEFEEIVTRDHEMMRLFQYMRAIGKGTRDVLISGSTGTGKELFARALHRLSRPTQPFVAVNVAGLDDSMFSDTLFGHVEGAYTGASTNREGMIEKAGSGTLFLDEIGDLPETAQVKLLRLLQEREYFPLGSDVPCVMKSRVLAATHRDITDLRPDLYFRLRTYHVEIPDLRDRLGDLPLLVAHFLELAAEDLGIEKPTVEASLFASLRNYEFPGNVRELQSVVFDVIARNGGAPSLPTALFCDALSLNSSDVISSEIQFPEPMPTLREIEWAAVQEAMRRTKGNKAAAARSLGVSRPTIHRAMSSADADNGAEG